MKSELIGDKIKEYRKEKGITQAKLAELVGTSQQQIGMYEINKRTPRADMLVKIADALQVDYTDLLKNLSIQDQIDFIVYGGIDSRAEYKIQQACERMKMLNLIGMDEAIHQLDLLTMIPEYQATKPATADNSNE